MFVIKCLRIKNPQRAFTTRCKKTVDYKNGLLCKDCLIEAKRNPIYMLMHKSVTQKLKIPFKNQLFVKVDLSSKPKRPENKNVQKIKLKNNKDKLLKAFDNMDLTMLKKYHDVLNIGIWEELEKQQKTEYALRYTISREIINKMIFYSNKN